MTSVLEGFSIATIVRSTRTWSLRTRSRVDDDFECLAADAGEAVRHDLAVRMAAHLETLREHHPGVFELGSSDPRRFHCTVEQVSQEIYNPAQLDVLRRTTAMSWRGKDHAATPHAAAANAAAPPTRQALDE